MSYTAATFWHETYYYYKGSLQVIYYTKIMLIFY